MPGNKEQRMQYMQWIREYLERFKAGDGFSSPSAKLAYEALEESLRELTDYTEQFYVEDENGEYPMVQEQNYEELLDKFRKVSKNIDMYRKEAEAAIKGHAENPKAGDQPEGQEPEEAYLLDQARLDVVSKLEPMVSQDIQTLATAKAQGALNQSLGEMLEGGRIREVTYTGEVKTVGACLSQRIPVTIKNAKGEDVKGFFTAETFVNKDMKNVSDKAIEKYSQGNPQWAALYQKIYQAAWGSGNRTRLKKMAMIPYAQEKILDPTRYVKIALGPVPLSDAEKELLKDTRFVDACFSYLKDVCGEYSGYFQYAIRGVTTGALDKRNSAMTAMAEIMGLPDALAPSYSVKMNINGTEYNGTFMGFAKGEDLNQIKPDSPMVNEMDCGSMENPEFLKSVANLQAIDFLCGNTDRHLANQFYQLDNSNPPKIIGVQGIDNDMSFCTDQSTTNFPVKLEEMGFITESTARTIMTMTPEMLRPILQGYGLSKEDVDGACERLTNLQQSIVEGKMYYADKDIDTFEEGHLKVVKDEDLPKISLFGSLSEIGRNHFNRMTSVMGAAARHITNSENEAYKSSFKALKDNWRGMTELQAQMQEANRGKFIGSSEYRTALSGVNQMMANRNHYIETGNKELAGKYLRTLKAAKEAVDDYLSAKAGKLFTSEREIKRYLAMQNAREVLQKEVDAMVPYTEAVKGIAEKSNTVQRRQMVIRNNQAFLKQRAQLRQELRIKGDEKRRAVFQSLPKDMKANPERSMDFVMATMAEKAGNKLGDMNTDRSKNPEFLKEKVRGFATLAVEWLWRTEQKAGGTGPLHTACKDKNALMTQIERLATNRQFAEKTATITIPFGIRSMKDIVAMAKPVLQTNLTAVQNHAPAEPAAPEKPVAPKGPQPPGIG